MSIFPVKCFCKVNEADIYIFTFHLLSMYKGIEDKYVIGCSVAFQKATVKLV